MKTERIVDNPENHGWELVGGKWIWASGRNTGHITDGDLNGETTVWKDNQSAWVPNPRLVFNDGGYAHFTSPVKSDDRFHVAGGGGMTRTPSGGLNLYTENNAGSIVLDETGNATLAGNFTIDRPSGGCYQDFKSDVGHYRTGLNSAGSYYVYDISQSAERLNINASGSATFSGVVQARTRVNIDTRPEGNEVLGSLLITTAKADGTNTGARFGHDGSVAFINASTNSNQRMLTIDSSGNATFSGSVNAPNHFAPDSNVAAGYGFGGKSRLEVFKDTESAIYGGTQLVATFKSDKDTVFQGNIYKNGTTPVLSTRDLIETLATLRASTLDETVDVRQALASACDKLIEKFEAMQDQAVTQDIQE